VAFVAGMALFRADDIGDAGCVIRAMAGLHGLYGGADVTAGFA
jgi:hypothetical protein